MKIRKHRKKEYLFRPVEGSEYFKKPYYIFKYKSSLIKFLNKNPSESINGTVDYNESCFGGSGCLKSYYVWYKYCGKRKNIIVDLRLIPFRGRKWIFKPQKVSKVSKKYFAFSDKVINLMYDIKDENGNIEPKKAKKLVELFKKRGFEDFEPSESELEYINGNISVGIDFYYWSDRCNWLRTKTIIEYFKRNGLI